MGIFDKEFWEIYLQFQEYHLVTISEKIVMHQPLKMTGPRTDYFCNNFFFILGHPTEIYIDEEW